MIGQSYVKYEIFPKLDGLDQIDIDEIIKQQTIKPIENQNENFTFYEVNMKNQVSLYYLMECVPFIKITFGQLLYILRDVMLKSEKYIKLGFIPEQISTNNVYIILKDMQFTYFYQKLDYDIDIIGVKWIKQVKTDQQTLNKFESIMKNFVLQTFTLFKQKYEMKMGQKQKYLLDQFFNNYNINYNALDYIIQFIQTFKCNMEQQFFLEEQNSLRKEYDKINTQIKSGQYIIDSIIMEQQKLINQQLENNYKQTIISTLRAHMHYVFYNLLYQEIDAALVIYDKISDFVKKLDSMITSFNQLIEFDNETIHLLLKNQYQKQFQLKEHFSRYYNIEVNWISTFKFDFINSFFMIAGQSARLNKFNDLLQVLNYIQNFNKNRQIQQKICYNPIEHKNYDQALICLLQQYSQHRIDQLF